MDSIAKEKTRSYWPTMRLVLEPSVVELDFFKEDGSARYVRRAIVSSDEIDSLMEEIRDWIMQERYKYNG